MFKHDSNNQVTISDLTLPLAFFQQQEPAYMLPEGAIGVEYSPGSHHIIFYPGQIVGGGSVWEEGDVYLSKIDAYRAAWEASQAPKPLTLEQAKAQKIATLSFACKNEILAGFDSAALGTSHYYSAELEDQLNLIGSALLSSDVPYVCADLAGVKAARLHTAAQMAQVYGNGAVAKGEKIFKFHALREQVEAASTIEAVELIVWQAQS